MAENPAAARMVDAALWTVRSAQALLRSRDASGPAMHALAAVVPLLVEARQALQLPELPELPCPAQ